MRNKNYTEKREAIRYCGMPLILQKISTLSVVVASYEVSPKECPLNTITINCGKEEKL
jgi:hypothetical protein